MANKEPENDDIVKYLGFGVHPGKIEEFWETDDEEKRYRQQVKARGGQIAVLDRETAILNTRLMSRADRIISYIGSFLLIISFLLPVYSFAAGEKNISGSLISLVMNIGVAGGYAAWGGGVMILSLIVFTLYLISCPVVGVVNLLGLMNKAQGDDYLQGVKQYSRIIVIPITLLAVLILLLLFGAPQPFGSLGVTALGETLSLGAIFTMTGAGFWLSIAGLAIVFAERRGI